MKNKLEIILFFLIVLAVMLTVKVLDKQEGIILDQERIH